MFIWQGYLSLGLMRLFFSLLARAGELNKWLKMVFILLLGFGGNFGLHVSSSSSCMFARF